MHLLTRICLQNWYLIDAKDIEIKGATALIGPTGAGKSSIQDAIQTVITGANQNRLTLNPSASGKSARTVLEYCLGMTGDPSEGGKPLRTSCETVIALVFRDEETDEPITVGIAMSAREGDSREEVLSRFIIPGHAYSVEEARRRDGARTYLAPWAEIAANLRSRHPRFEEYRTSAEKFTADMLAIMRGGEQPPNVRHFLRAFANAHAFRPIFDPTVFVRDYILEPDPLDLTRVRTSIETWQELERTIEEIEAKLARITRITSRFRNWGRARMKAEASRFLSAAAEARRLAHDVIATSEVLARHKAELASERNILASRRQWVREFDEQIRAKQALVLADNEASRLRQIEMEVSMAERDAREAEERWNRIREMAAAITRLAPLSSYMSPRHARAVEAAREALTIMKEGQDPADAIRGKGERLQELLDEMLALDGWEGQLLDKADALAEELRAMQRDVDELEQALARCGSGGAALSRETMKLLEVLQRRGIDPVPLCDVVEVVDEDWQYAVEALLGRGREAIIVDPERLHEAFELMWRDRDIYSGCTLVKTTQTHSISPRVPPGSIVEAVTSDNEHAMAFLNVRIGAFRKAETEADLERLDRGVMKNGKTSSGMGLSVQRNLRDLVLGRAARERSAESLRNALSPKRASLHDLRQAVRMLREAARILPGVVETLRSGMGPFELEHSLVSSQTRRDALLRQRKAASAGTVDDLVTEIRELEEERDAYAKEIAEEIEPRVEELQGLVAQARAKSEVARSGLRQAVAARRKAWERLSSPDLQRILRLDDEIDEPDALGVLSFFREEVRRQEASRKDPKAWLASFRNDHKLIAENSDAEARRDEVGVLRDLTEYGINWGVTIPEVGVANMTVGYAWAVGEQTRLHGNELRQHREATAKAASEMRRMLKEDLLARLAEKLNKVHDRLDSLNKLLARHRFTGQVYSFTADIDQRYRRLYDLAMRVGGGIDTSGDVLDGLDDEEVASALAELEGMIEGANEAAVLADYRNYFTFEIVMTDRQGARTTMSTRAVKGSGGEAQAPFYVAIAASLASAYFPGLSQGRPKGMGLALFDEAFNKLDVPNTQALLTFFSDMGLQLMIAGPEDKRATFTEVLDTIVLVNKSLDGTSVYIDAEFPGELARRELARINPDHIGVDGFRSADTVGRKGAALM